MTSKRNIASPSPTVANLESLQTKPEVYFAELEKAAHRTGVTPEEVIGWLLRFSRMKLEDLSLGEWLNLTYEVARLGEFQYQPHIRERSWWLTITAHNWYGMDQTQGLTMSDTNTLKALHAQIVSSLMPRTTARKVRRPDISVFCSVRKTCTLPNREIITTLQDQVRLHLQQLIDEGSTILDIPPVLLGIGTNTDSEDALITEYADSPQAIFVRNLALILSKTAMRLYSCRECHLMFYADRGGKKYCSSRCQSRAGTRRYRNTPPERVGKLGRPRTNPWTEARAMMLRNRQISEDLAEEIWQGNMGKIAE
jgi:hypothetical protein